MTGNCTREVFADGRTTTVMFSESLAQDLRNILRVLRICLNLWKNVIKTGILFDEHQSRHSVLHAVFANKERAIANPNSSFVLKSQFKLIALFPVHQTIFF